MRKIAILRLDFNTEDDWRMSASLPTINFLRRYAEKIVIIGHKGRPTARAINGSPQGKDVKSHSLRSEAKKLARLVRHPITFIDHLHLDRARQEIGQAPKGSLFLLQNVRFFSGEEKNSPLLGKELAKLGDYFVNDAFAVSHRSNASLVAITKFLPSFAGLNLETEVKTLHEVMEHPRHPMVVVLGGGKASDKLGIILRLRKKASIFLIGGAAANTMLFVAGVRVGSSLRERHKKILHALRPVLAMKHLMLPTDWRVEGSAILDIGPRTQKLFSREIEKARTIIWSGPVGKFEEKRFALGSKAIALAIRKNKKAFSLVGGGETIMFLKKYKLDRGFSFISTGGGAMLEFLSGEKLPGVEALKK